MKVVKRFMRHELASVILPLIVLFVILLVGSPGFLSEYNMISVMQNISIYVLIGISQMAALALGQFNLAIGAMGCLSAICMGFFMQVLGMPAIVAVLLGLVVAFLLGSVQGALIAKTGISPFILTLALQSVYNGIAAVWTKGSSYNELPTVIQDISRTMFGAVPLTFLIAIGITIAAFIAYHYTNFGRNQMATGANRIAAKFSGINVDRATIMGHSMSGLFAGCAAFIQICKFNSAQLAIGSDWMMTSFVVAVLGGTLLSGGKITVIGTLLGSALMVFINNALGLWRVNTYMFQTIMGILLLVAYEIDRARLSITKKQSSILEEDDAV